MVPRPFEKRGSLCAFFPTFFILSFRVQRGMERGAHSEEGELAEGAGRSGGGEGERRWEGGSGVGVEQFGAGRGGEGVESGSRRLGPFPPFSSFVLHNCFPSFLLPLLAPHPPPLFQTLLSSPSACSHSWISFLHLRPERKGGKGGERWQQAKLAPAKV